MTDGMLLREFLSEPDLGGYRYCRFSCVKNNSDARYKTDNFSILD